MIRRWFDTVITYLTVLSALALPVALLGWGRSFFIYDRVMRADGGLALVASSHNGELTLWTAATHPEVRVYDHRARESSHSFTARRSFDRIGADEQFWVLGFGHATVDRLPGRLPLTGRASVWVAPYWGIALLFGTLPFWLIVKQAEPYRPPPEETPEPLEADAPPSPAFDPMPPAGPLGYGPFPGRRPTRIAAIGDRRWR